jgi:hypothetical protein
MRKKKSTTAQPLLPAVSMGLRKEIKQGSLSLKAADLEAEAFREAYLKGYRKSKDASDKPTKQA